jgi:crotonobetainyl-CoA:carnitine CoA-transferase CaiB-like acyl-CoA transferase
VIELAERVAGEYCGKLLADFGAQVVKIECPGGGSPTRHMGPFAGDASGRERSGLFAYLNTNKKSVTLGVETAAGRRALASLIENSDIVIDDHAPGWLKKIGLDPGQVRSGMILCSITPFGQSPPPDRWNAVDLTVMHSSGWGYHTPSGGEDDRPPLKGAGRFLASYEAGLEAAMCIAANLCRQENSGKGCFIDISAQAVMASRADYVLGQMVAGDMDADASRHRFDLGGPAGIFPCREGFVYIWMSAPAHWDGLRKLLGQPEWTNAFPVNWLERGLTPERIAECRLHLAEWLKTQDKDEAAAAAQALGLTMVPVNGASDLIRSPQFVHRGFFAEIEHPALGRALYPTVPYKLSLTPARIAQAAPLLGQHNDEELRP